MKALLIQHQGAILAIGAVLAGGVLVETISAQESIRFNRDVRPILSDHCYRCHGPDSAARKAGLRLDSFEAAVNEAGVIVPGDPDASELTRRIHSEDPEWIMPQPEIKKPLSAKQIAILDKWIEQGAQYEPHWSFVPPKKATLPEDADGQHPIDAFISARLEEEELVPKPRATRERQLRRLTYDLTGLPPTVEELDVFLADDSTEAYERAVDRLLASERYGEHMARYWLDAARYGDTHGLHLDNLRTMWKYRDWVVAAFNRNEPFDSFTRKQLAGDLLENPSVEDQIASGFIRAHVTTSEGGAINEEYVVKYAVDRTETAGTIWMGLTVGCAACHDHKYDPVSRREFYELFAFFNNTTEAAMDGNIADTPPVIKVGSPEQNERAAQLASQIEVIDRALKTDDAQVRAQEREWSQEHFDARKNDWDRAEPLSIQSREGATYAQQPDGSWLQTSPLPPTDVVDVFLELPQGVPVHAVRLDCLEDPSLPYGGPGGGPANGNFVLTELQLAVAPRVTGVSGPVADAEYTDVRVTTARSTHDQLNWPVLEAVDESLDPAQGWAILNANAQSFAQSAIFMPEHSIGGLDTEQVLRVRMHFLSQYTAHSIGRFRVALSTDPKRALVFGGTWHYHGPITVDSRATGFNENQGADGIKSLDDAPFAWTPRTNDVDGTVISLSEGTNHVHYLARTIVSPEERSVVVSLGTDDAVKCWLNGSLVHKNDVLRGVSAGQDQVTLNLAEGENLFVMKVVNYLGACGYVFDLKSGGRTTPFSVELALALEEDERSEAQNEAIKSYWREEIWPEGKKLRIERDRLVADSTQLDKEMVTTLIAVERMERRPAYMLARGQYDQPEDQVQPGTPAALPVFGDERPRNRLGFADWLLQPQHPLTARVTVNRFWQQFLGTGLVETSEDFGSQGDAPTHPELLDWLAIDFVEHDWDIKRFVKQLVMTETYRRSGRADEVLLERDPENRLLARGARYRLDGEQIRDGALYVSGLLVEKVGGAPVKPYQPPGIWQAVGYTRSNTQTFVQDHGEALYRRTLYSFWKRTAPPPSMTTFDAPSREACTVRRERTNTPLQALVTLNDIQFVEAARFFAERMMQIAQDAGDEAALAWGFRSMTSRAPDHEELILLNTLLDETEAEYAEDTDSAMKLLAVGEAPRDDSLDPAKHAAWTNLANILMNLDESLTKG